MFGKKKGLPIKKEFPIYNLDIELEGWRGPFHSLSHFNSMSKMLNEFEDISGLCYLTNQGRIKRGTEFGLHTLKGSIDVDDFSGNGTHMHYNNGGMNYIIRKGKKFFFKEFLEDTILEDKIDMNEINESRAPWFTLMGLYASLPEITTDTKIKAIENVLERNRNYKFDSIAIRKELKLKLLENKYRIMISNQ